VLRLAASLAITGREMGLHRRHRADMVTAAIARYRSAMRRFAGLSDLGIWYARPSATEVRRLASAQVPRPVTKRGGDVHFEAQLHEMLVEYRGSLKSDRRHLLGGYEYAHVTRSPAGVGSVGTRAWVVLLTSRVTGDPLLLQIKEARASVLEPYAGRPPVRHHGQRVVEGQWLMQAASDIFLGWLRSESLDGAPRDYHVRQLWDRRSAADLETMTEARLRAHATLCAWTLARAHARSGDRVAIGAYLGSGDVFDRAVAAFAETYADCNERDHAALVAAVAAGRVAAA
jgi:uncharacterized protein (DUF2252 family)